MGLFPVNEKHTPAPPPPYPSFDPDFMDDSEYAEYDEKKKKFFDFYFSSYREKFLEN